MEGLTVFLFHFATSAILHSLQRSLHTQIGGTQQKRFSPTAEAWGLSQTRHWGTVGQSSGEVP